LKLEDEDFWMKKTLSTRDEIFEDGGRRRIKKKRITESNRDPNTEGPYFIDRLLSKEERNRKLRD
jgi:hypothetical protein